MTSLPVISFSDAPPHTNKVIRWSGSVEQLKSRLLSMHRRDKWMEKLRVVFLLLSILQGVLALFVALPLYDDLTAKSWSWAQSISDATGIDHDLVVVVLYLGGWAELIGAVIALLALITVTVVLFRRDMDDRKIAMAWELLKMLGPETKRKGTASLTIDFRGYHKSKDYAVQWLEMGLPLLDGSTLTLRITQRVVRKKKPKRKYTKITDKVREILTVETRLPSNRAVSPRAVDLVRATLPKLGDWMRPVKFQLKPRGLLVVVSTRAGRRVYGKYGWTSGTLATTLLTPASVILILQAVVRAGRYAEVGAAAQAAPATRQW